MSVGSTTAKNGGKNHLKEASDHDTLRSVVRELEAELGEKTAEAACFEAEVRSVRERDGKQTRERTGILFFFLEEKKKTKWKIKY